MLWRRGKYVLVVAAIAGLAACGAGHSGGSSGTSTSGHSASSAAANADKAATAADQQLAADGYDATHIPGFGHADLGITSKPGKSRYELVYTYTGKNASLLKDMVTSAQQKLTGQKGVTIAYVNGKSLIVVRAASLSDLHTALKALLASIK
jgi:hypothetical protein